MENNSILHRYKRWWLTIGLVVVGLVAFYFLVIYSPPTPREQIVAYAESHDVFTLGEAVTSIEWDVVYYDGVRYSQCLWITSQYGLEIPAVSYVGFMKHLVFAKDDKVVEMENYGIFNNDTDYVILYIMLEDNYGPILPDDVFRTEWEAFDNGQYSLYLHPL